MLGLPETRSSSNLARMKKMLLQLLMMTSLVQGVQGQTMNERNIGIIVGAIGGAVLIVLIVLVCCVLCRPKDRRRKQGTPSVFVNGGVYGNGTLPIGKPGVWTTNPTFFVGVPSPAYSAAAGKKPVLAYRHSVAGRPYNGYTHINPDKRNGGLPIYSQPDLRGSLVMEERRRQGILVDSNSSMVRAYSDYNGNKQLGPPGERYVAKVYSGYNDGGSHGNVARVYSNYSTPDLRMNSRYPVYPDTHVARAVVRHRDGTLDRIDEYTDVAASTPSVHAPYNDLSKPQLTRPVTRTQSYQDRQSPSRHLRPGSLIRTNAPSDVASHVNGFPGHKPLDRSSSDAIAHANRRLERQPLDDSHPQVARSRSADQQIRPFGPLPKLPQAANAAASEPAKDSIKSNTIDSPCDVHSPVYASLGEATSSSVERRKSLGETTSSSVERRKSLGETTSSSVERRKSNQTSNSVLRTSIAEEDLNALYALPMKIKRPQTEGGSGRSQYYPEGQSPSPSPPPPPPPLRPLSESKPEPPAKSAEISSEQKPEVKQKTLEKDLPKVIESNVIESPNVLPSAFLQNRTSPKQETKPDNKPAPKQETKPDNKPVPKQETEPDNKPVPKQETKSDNKLAPTQEIKPDNIPVPKEETKLESKPVAKPDIKPAPKQDLKPVDKPDSKLDSQPAKTLETKATSGDQKPESDSESITYAKAGEHITDKAFEFLDNYALEETSSVISNNFETTSLTGCEVTDQLFGFLDSYPDVTCDTFGAEAHGSFSSSSQETIIQNPLPGGHATPDILLDHGRVTLEVFSFLDEYTFED